MMLTVVRCSLLVDSAGLREVGSRCSNVKDTKCIVALRFLLPHSLESHRISDPLDINSRKEQDYMSIC